MLTNADIKRIKEDHGKLALTKRIEELDKSLSIALDINDTYQRENKKLNEKIKEVEEALTKALAGDHRVAESDKIIMKKITEIEELKAELARAKEDHQYDNLVHKHELERLTKK